MSNLVNIMKFETYKDLIYRIYIPKVKKDKYRLFIYLHGAGERGDDGISHISVNAEVIEKIINDPRYGSETIIIAPQVPADGYWVIRDELINNNYSFEEHKKTAIMDRFIDFIDNELFNKYNIDKSKITVAGISMGAGGSAELIYRYPHLFKSALLICGVLDNNLLAPLTNTKLWLFHSSDDPVVNFRSYDKAYPKLNALGANINYTRYEDAGHGSWVRAYQTPNLLDYLFN